MAVYDVNGNQLYSIYDTDGSELYNSYDIEGSLIYSRTGTIALRVMSFNVQGFTGINAISSIQNEAFVTQGADIIGMQEYQSAGSKYIDGMTVENYLHYVGYNDYKVGSLAVNKTFFASKYPYSNFSEKVYDTIYSAQDVRSYIKCYMNIGGKQIAFYNTHLDVAASSYRIAQIQELIEDMEQEDSFILVGDLNTTCIDTTGKDYAGIIAPLINAGYNVANCNPNRDGFIQTWTGGADFTGGYYCTDNIVTSSDISMNTVWADYYKVSNNPDSLTIDHVPLLADLEITL